MKTAKGLGLLVLLIAPFYMWRVYDSFFEVHPGYIYDPESRTVYWLRLSPSIYRYEHWKRHLMPFGSPSFTQISYVDRSATLDQELEDVRKPFDPAAVEAWAEELSAQKLEDIEVVDAQYWPRGDLDPIRLLPREWHRLPSVLGDIDGKVLPADVVLAHYPLNRGVPVDIQILRGVLFLNDRAAYTLNAYCFSPSPDQWPECTPG